MQPKVISTFAGTGGSSMGYKMAGYDMRLAVEWDDHAVECYRLNYPETKVYHGDIGKLTVERAMELAGIAEGELDVLDGSPPCQGFSTAGRRNLNDERNQLFREYVRLLRGLKPRAFVMENVAGMIKGKMKLLFAEILRELKGSGYQVKARLLNAMYFGVPQSRERMIFVGVRDDLGIQPAHPAPQTYPIPLRDAIPSLRAARSQRINPWIKDDRPAPTVCKVHTGYVGLPQLTDRMGKLWPKVPIGGNAATVLGTINNAQSCMKVDPRKPSPTIPKMQLGHGVATMVHPYEPRPLTIEECKLICSFPLDFKLTGSYSQQWARLGNSVPPLMAKAVAETVRREILERDDAARAAR